MTSDDVRSKIRSYVISHFHLARTRNVGGKEMLYFYLDLYEGEKPKE